MPQNWCQVLCTYVHAYTTYSYMIWNDWLWLITVYIYILCLVTLSMTIDLLIGLNSDCRDYGPSCGPWFPAWIKIPRWAYQCPANLKALRWGSRNEPSGISQNAGSCEKVQMRFPQQLGLWRWHLKIPSWTELPIAFTMKFQSCAEFRKDLCLYHVMFIHFISS